MALSIKNSETERLARELAKVTGESLTEAITSALRERLQRLKKRRRQHIVAEKLEDILKRVDSLPTLNTRPEEEILGHDDPGIRR